MITSGEIKKSRKYINSVIFSIENLTNTCPNTNIWWFGSSVENQKQEIGDIDLAIISSSKKELTFLKKKLRKCYPNSHFDNARIYTKSNNNKLYRELPIHFIFGRPHEVFSNTQLINGIQNGINVTRGKWNG